MIEKIRAIFWAQKVLKLDGLEGVLASDKKLRERLKKTLDERYNALDSSTIDERIYDVAMASFSDKASWKKYLAGESIPKYSEEGEFFTSCAGVQQHPYIVNIVEALFPELDGLFEDGPYGLISVLKSECAGEALQELELRVVAFVKRTGYTRADDIQTWSDAKFLINQQPDDYLNIIDRFLPNIEDYNGWNHTNEEVLFLLLISAYIDARFMKILPYDVSNWVGVDAGRLAEVAIFSVKHCAGSGILYFEHEYHLDRKIWFDVCLFENKVNVLDIARRNTINLFSEIGIPPSLRVFMFE